MIFFLFWAPAQTCGQSIMLHSLAPFLLQELPRDHNLNDCTYNLYPQTVHHLRPPSLGPIIDCRDFPSMYTIVCYLCCIWHPKWTVNASRELHPQLSFANPKSLSLQLESFLKVAQYPCGFTGCSIGFHLESHYWYLLLSDPWWPRKLFKYDKSCPWGHTFYCKASL